MDYIAENYDQNQRNEIGKRLMRITLKELFEYRFMQTDPNPANFFFNKAKDLLYLIDFGAAREYSKEFVNLYIQIIFGAAQKNKELCQKVSKDIGFLSGEENRVMLEAHTNSIMVVGDPFTVRGSYDFGSQDITEKVIYF